MQKEKFLDVFIRRFIIFKKFFFSGIRILMSGPYFADRIITAALLFSFIINISIWYYIYKNQITGDYPVILHYNLIFGVDYLGDYVKAYFIPFVGAIILITNTLLSHFVYSRERLASYFLVINVLIIQIFLFFAGYLIIRVNS
ncbi:MAG: hypothetical protein WA063_03675 [Minisyncoccia bacterium]